MTDLSAHGISVTVPSGWEGRVFRRPAAGEIMATAADGPPAPPGEITNAVVHVSTIALPPDAGDFASGAVDRLGPDDALVVLFEYDAASVEPAVVRRGGIPRALSPDDFSPGMLQRTLRGQAGAQRFFQEAGRAFCLYVVLGSFVRRQEMVGAVNEVLASLEVGGVRTDTDHQRAGAARILEVIGGAADLTTFATLLSGGGRPHAARRAGTVHRVRTRQRRVRDHRSRLVAARPGAPRSHARAPRRRGRLPDVDADAHVHRVTAPRRPARDRGRERRPRRRGRRTDRAPRPASGQRRGARGDRRPRASQVGCVGDERSGGALRDRDRPARARRRVQGARARRHRARARRSRPSRQPHARPRRRRARSDPRGRRARHRQSGAVRALVAVSYALFAVVVAAALRSGKPISSCGCFGKVDTPPSALHVVLNVVAAGVAAGAVFVGASEINLPDVLADQPLLGIPFLLLVAVGVGSRVPRAHRAPQDAGRGAVGAPMSIRPDPASPGPSGESKGVAVTNWFLMKATGFIEKRASRRGFLIGSALAGSAVAASGIDFVTRPGSAYAAGGRLPAGVVLRRRLHRVLLRDRRRRAQHLPARLVRRRMVARRLLELLRRRHPLLHRLHAGLLRAGHRRRLLRGMHRVPVRVRLRHAQGVLQLLPLRAVPPGDRVRRARSRAGSSPASRRTSSTSSPAAPPPRSTTPPPSTPATASGSAGSATASTAADRGAAAVVGGGRVAAARFDDRLGPRRTTARSGSPTTTGA